MDSEFGNWLAGFIDGEGCFAIKSVSNGFTTEFNIRVRDDERPILEEIVAQTGIGYVRKDRSRRSVQGYISQPLAIWSVHKKSECRKLADLLVLHPLRAKKARDFAYWLQALIAWESIERLGTGPTMLAGKKRNRVRFQLMADMKLQMETTRKYAK